MQQPPTKKQIVPLCIFGVNFTLHITSHYTERIGVTCVFLEILSAFGRKSQMHRD